MATDPDQKKVKDLGIRVDPNDGSFIVEAMLNGSRHQPKFYDQEIAVAYANYRDECDARAVPLMEGKAFRKAWSSRGAVFIEAQVEPALVSDLLDRFTAVVGEAQQYVNVLKAFLGELESEPNVSEITPDITQRLPKWLQEQRYSRTEANRVIKTADQAWDMFIGMGVATHNFWKGLKAKKTESELDRRHKPRVHAKAPAFGPKTLLAVAHLLRRDYLLAFWIIAILALRRSEAMGLRVVDWEPTKRRLTISGQRKGSWLKGRSPGKTTASIRSIVVPTALASAIDRYLAEHHGTPPDDPAEAKDWWNRYLLRGVHGGPMDSASFMAALRAAYIELGLVPEVIGRFRPIHHLRKSVGARLQQRKKKPISGPAVAELLGHEHPSRNDNDMPAVSAKHYNPLKSGSLTRMYEFLESWTNDKIVSRIESGDLLQLNELEDPIPAKEAARILQHARPAATDDDVKELIAAGLLPARKVKHGSEYQTVVVDRLVLEQFVSETVREESDSYSTEETCHLLACDRDVVYRLAGKNGPLVEVTKNARERRRGARGSGALPGGGRRFTKSSVDDLVELEQDAIERRRNWVSVGQAAALLGVSASCVRRRLVEFEWRDPWSVHERRLYDPARVEQMAAELREIPVKDAADLIGATLPLVRALIKTGELRPGKNGAWVRAIDVERLLERSADAEAV